MTNAGGLALALTVGNADQSATYSGSLSGAGASLTKIGSGTQALSGNNTYTGTTIISGGALQIGDGGTTGTLGSGSVVNNAWLLINRSDAFTLVNTISGAGGVITLGTGTTTLTASNSFTGIATAVGRLVNGNATGLGSALLHYSDKVVFADGITGYTIGGLTGGNDFAMTNAGGLALALTVGNADQSAGYLGNLSGEGASLTKIGSGTQALAGNNIFSGGTTISEGRLELASISGSALGATSAVTVASGAKLLLSQSDQVSNSALTTLSGGTIELGGGVSEVFGNLSVMQDSFLDFGIGAGGTLAFGSYAPSQLLTISHFLAGDTLIFGSDLRDTVNNPSLFSFDGEFESFWDAGTTTFTITAATLNVPEPSIFALLALGVVGLVGYQPRRRARG